MKASATKVSPLTRKIMLANRPRGNKTTELAMVKLLRSAGLTGWRRHMKLHGTPDFVWQKKHIAVFVDGCFWHGCPYCKKLPDNYKEFWTEKIRRNRARDRRVSRLLRAMKWKVLRVWECKIRSERTLTRLRSAISQRD